MNTSEPHDILEISPGKKAPKGYIPISEKEVERLRALLPEAREEWLRQNLVLIERKDMRTLTNLPLRERGEKLREMLVGLGWTPPAEGGDVD